MLTKTFEIIKIMCVQYWPSHVDQAQHIGPYTITTVEEETYAVYKVKKLFAFAFDESLALPVVLLK